MSGFDDTFGGTQSPANGGYYPSSNYQPPAYNDSISDTAGYSRPPRKRGPRALVITIVSLVVVALLGGSGYWAFTAGPLNGVFAPADDFQGSGTGEVLFTIKDGDIGDVIADNLVEAGVIKSFDPFYKLLLEADPQIVFVPGTYKLKLGMSSQAALDALQNFDNVVTVTVVVPEGEVMSDILDTISNEADLPLNEVQAAAADYTTYGLPPEASSLEGFLFPATYDFSPGLSAREILQAMVDRCFEALDSAGVAEADRYRVIVFASLVQKESGLKDDFYKVARVFQNRLDQGWNMESDATVAYGTGHTDRVETTSAERADEGNLYNTYVHPGLPFAPISNPGDVAIDAVMHPADGPWMFFVTWNLDTGETIFSETAEEHQAGVDQWIAWMDEHPEYQ